MVTLQQQYQQAQAQIQQQQQELSQARRQAQEIGMGLDVQGTQLAQARREAYATPTQLLKASQAGQGLRLAQQQQQVSGQFQVAGRELGAQKQQVQAYTQELGRTEAEFGSQVRDFELDVARQAPELAKPELVKQVAQEARSQLLSQKQEVESSLNKEREDFNQMRKDFISDGMLSGSEIDSIDRGEERLNRQTQLAEAKLRAINEGLAGNDVETVQKFYSGQVNALTDFYTSQVADKLDRAEARQEARRSGREQALRETAGMASWMTPSERISYFEKVTPKLEAIRQISSASPELKAGEVADILRFTKPEMFKTPAGAVAQLKFTKDEKGNLFYEKIQKPENKPQDFLVPTSSVYLHEQPKGFLDTTQKLFQDIRGVARTSHLRGDNSVKTFFISAGAGLGSSLVGQAQFGRDLAKNPIGTTKNLYFGVKATAKKVYSGEGFPELKNVFYDEPGYLGGFVVGEVLGAKGLGKVGSLAGDKIGKFKFRDLEIPGSPKVKLFGFETGAGRGLTFGSKIEGGALGIGRPKVIEFLKKMPDTTELKLGSALETSTIKKALKSAPEASQRAKEGILVIQDILRKTKNVKSSFIKPENIFSSTERLPQQGVKSILDIAKEYQGVLFGSKSRDVQLAQEYLIGGQKFKLNKVPRDVELRFDTFGEAELKGVTEETISRLKKLGKIKEGNKVFDLSSARKISDDPFAIEAKVNNKFEKVAEFKGKEARIEGEEVPEFVVGLKKVGSPFTIDKIKVTKLDEELRGVSQGVARVRKSKETGLLDLYPSPKRQKDIGSVFVSALSLKRSKFFPSMKLNKAIEKFQELYPKELTFEQLSKIAEDKIPIADFSKRNIYPKENYFFKGAVYSSVASPKFSSSRILSPSGSIKKERYNSPNYIKSSSRYYLTSPSPKYKTPSKSYSPSISRSSGPYMPKFPSPPSLRSPSPFKSPSPIASPSKSPYPIQSPRPSPSPSPSKSPYPSPSPRPAITPRPIRPQPYKFNVNSPYSKFKEKKKFKKLYFSEVGSRGKFKRISSSVSYEEALRRGKRAVFDFLGRSVRLREADTGRLVAPVTDKYFRSKKSDLFTLVQRNPLATRREVNLIQSYRKKKNLNSNFF